MARAKKAAPATVVTGIKGFDSNLACRGFQFEVGKTHEHGGAVKACRSGFHFVDGNPLSVLDYYPLIADDGSLNRFCSVEATGIVEREEDKAVTASLTVKAELRLPEIIAAAVNFVIAACKTDDKVQAASGDYSKLAASGDYSKLAASGGYSQLAASGGYSQLAASGGYSQLAASGGYSQLAASGHSSKLAASGDYSKLAASGGYSQLAASGHSSKLAASGHSSQLAASGGYSQLAASGDSSKLAASGGYSKLAASGDYSQLAVDGPNSAAAAVGRNSVIKGATGNAIAICEYDDSGKPIGFATGIIGKRGLKPDTFYRAKGGKLVAA